jgi:hypothetical protein
VTETAIKIRVSDIFLDESIYPRENIDHNRIGGFIENLRDGHLFYPIQVQICPDSELPYSQYFPDKVWYRILDGVHRWNAFKKTGRTQIDA